MSAVQPEPLTRLRPMTEEDLHEVVEIEHSAYGFPWPLGIFRDCLRVGYCCWLLERRDRIEAYGIMSVAAGEAHLLNLCVRDGSRRMGLGKRLLGHLMDIALERRADTMFLEVRSSNQAARHLYQNMGFNAAGIRRGYYPGSQHREDALVLACHIAATVADC